MVGKGRKENECDMHSLRVIILLITQKKKPRLKKVEVISTEVGYLVTVMVVFSATGAETVTRPFAS